MKSIPTEMFWLWSACESITDSIVVDDAPPFDWLLVGIGVSALVIVAVVVIFLRRR